jgi:phosphoglycerate-specific signal transduction histidine kinase
MNFAALVTATLFLLAAPAQQGPPPVSKIPPPRQTFIAAAQVVLDNADAVDLKAGNDHFPAQMQQLKQSSDNLTNMAADEGEQNIAVSMKDIIFQISSCHIQAIDGTAIDKCQAQIKSAEKQAMTVLNRHKEGSSWVEGPPA